VPAKQPAFDSYSGGRGGSNDAHGGVEDPVGLADLGAMFPGSEKIGDNIAALKAADAEKGAALEKDFAELQGSLGNPDQVKAKAKEMLGKL